MDIKQKIIQKFNAQLGSNLRNLEEIYDFHEYLKAEKDEIEKSVSLLIRRICNMKKYYIFLFLIVINGLNNYSVQSKSGD